MGWAWKKATVAGRPSHARWQVLVAITSWPAAMANRGQSPIGVDMRFSHFNPALNPSVQRGVVIALAGTAALLERGFETLPVRCGLRSRAPKAAGGLMTAFRWTGPPYGRILRARKQGIALLTRPLKPLIARVLLVLVFVLAQAGAQLHAYSHLTADQSGKPPATQSQGCPECLSFAPLVHAAGGPDNAILFLPRDAVDVIPAPLATRVDRFHSHSFRSRAPPVLH